MLTKIVIVVALSCGVKFPQVQKQVLEMQAKNPGAVVSYQINKKAACVNGNVVLGKDAKAIEALGQ
jgi:hypothetical protein